MDSRKTNRRDKSWPASDREGHSFSDHDVPPETFGDAPSLLAAMEDVGILFDERGSIRDISPAGAARLGYERTDLIGADLSRLIPRGFALRILSLVRGTPPYPLQKIRLLDREERLVPVEANLGRMSGGETDLILLVGRDVSLRLREEETLEQSEERYHTIFDHSPLGILHIDHDGIATDVNETMAQILGSRREKILGLNMVERLRDERMREAVFRSLSGELGRFEGRYTPVTGDRTTWIKALFNPMTSRKGTFLGVVGVVEDISERKQAEERIAYLSYHDPLTGLLNRHSFEREFARLDHHRELPLGLIMGDVNGLKLANDAFGHMEGDRLLRDIARILRETGEDEEPIFRWGGDEFLILIPRTDAARAAERCDRIHELCTHWRGSGIIRPSISLGWGMKDFPEEDFREVCLKAAEDRMYANKMREGKNNRMRVLAHLEENLHAKGGGRMGEHIRRMTDLGDRVAVALNLKETRRQDLHLLAQFHDLGLVNCPEAILSKPGPLSSEERGLVEEHPTTGYRIARSIPELTAIAELILAHHERWDGRGYPQGTRGSSIPETVRLFSVLNAFDAITHPRPYAPTLSSPEALKELRHCAGTQFDPQATDRIIPILDSWEGV